MPARRSSLSVPGSSERMLAKAAALEADEIVVDLEDSVATRAKDAARMLVADVLGDGAGFRAAVAVRVNPLGSPWGERDVTELVARAGPHIGSLVIPKVESAGDVLAVARLLAGAGEPARAVGLQALVETAGGLLHAAEIAAASPRVEALILGYADLGASLGRAPGPAPPERWLFAQETVLVAARAARVQAIDGPYLEIRDEPGLSLRARHARALGFDGKWAIHPHQLPTINAAFTPTEDELARAQAILDALAGAQGRGAVELEGEMLDEASRKLALQVVARGRAAGLDGGRR